MIRIFLTILCAFAFSEGTETVVFGGSGLDVLVYDKAQDYSLQYLNLLFGAGLGIPSYGYANPYTGSMFAFFNYGLLLLIFGFAGFTTLEAVLLSASESTMFRRKVKPLIIARNVGGILLVAPQASGFCLAQIMLMKVVVLGVAIANGAWITGLEYTSKMGGVAFTASAGNKFEEVRSKIVPFASDVYKSAYCLESKFQAQKDSVGARGRSEYTVRIGEECGSGGANTVCFGSKRQKTECGKYAGSGADATAIQGSVLQMARTLQPVATNQYLLDHSTGTIKSCVGNAVDEKEVRACMPAVMIADVSFAYYGNSLPFRAKAISMSSDSKVPESAQAAGWASAGMYFQRLTGGFSGSTGSVGFDSIDNFLPTTRVSSKVVPKNENNIRLMANSYISGVENADKTFKDDTGYEDEKIASSVIMLLRLAVPDKTFISDTLAGYVGGLTSFFGAFGVDLLTNYRSIYTMIAGVVEAFTGARPMAVPENKNAYEQFVGMIANWSSLATNPTCSSIIKCEGSSPTKCLEKIFSSDICMSNKSLGLIAQVKRKYEIAHETGATAKQPINPFIAMVKTGRLIVDSAMDYWGNTMYSSMNVMITMSWVFFAFKAILTAAATTVAAVCYAAGGYCIPVAGMVGFAWTTMTQIISMLFSQVMFIVDIPNGLGNALAMIFYSLGNFMGFFVPFIPMVVTTLAVVGWLMLVVEAMVATPLVALGLTNPKGHDFLGQAQQSIMMYVSTCLRPVLIIIAFMLAINLTYVAFDYLNYVFLITISTVLNVSDSEAAFNMLFIIGTLMVYSYFAFAVMMTVLEVINDLPDKVSRWIGGTMLSPGGNIKQMLSEAKGGVGSASSAVGSGASQAAAQGSGAVAQAAYGQIQSMTSSVQRAHSGVLAEARGGPGKPFDKEIEAPPVHDDNPEENEIEPTDGEEFRVDAAEQPAERNDDGGQDEDDQGPENPPQYGGQGGDGAAEDGDQRPPEGNGGGE